MRKDALIEAIEKADPGYFDKWRALVNDCDESDKMEF
jgi:hypothetical protein